MKKIKIVLSSILLMVLYFSIIDFTLVDAAKTGGYNFCLVFTAHPECAGWRTEPIADNYWFCDYVDLKNLCRNHPNHEKQILLRTQDYCCKYIGPELKNENNPEQNSELDQLIFPTEQTKSILPLIIWTDKDHYSYRDKIIVYGKFDFTNPTIKQNINEVVFAQTGEISEEKFAVDIKLNGIRVLRDIQVSPNGWFSAYFFHNNVYNFSTQNNLLEVEYVIYSDVIPLGGPKTHAVYQFTTGDIAKKDNSFDIWINNTVLPNTIRYGIIVENSERFIESMQHDLVKTRIITPDGYIIAIDSIFSIKDLSTEYKGFKEYGPGEYQIQVTYGDNTSKKIFEYTN